MPKCSNARYKTPLHPPHFVGKVVSLQPPPPHIPHQLRRPLLAPGIHLHHRRLRHLVLGLLAPVIELMLDLPPSLPRRSKRVLVRRHVVRLVRLVLCCRGSLLLCASAEQDQAEHDQCDQCCDAEGGADAGFGGCGEPAVGGGGGRGGCGWGCGWVCGRACRGGSRIRSRRRCCCRGRSRCSRSRCTSRQRRTE